MTTSRVPLLDPEAAQDAAAAVGVPAYMAELSIFKVLLHRPQLASALNGQLHALLNKGILDVRLREIVIMRIAWVTQSQYEWAQHWRVARSLDVPADALLSVREWQTATAFTRGERAALRAVDESIDVGKVSAEAWDELSEVYDDETLVELVAAIATWFSVSIILRVLQIPLENSEDRWPPDGIDPSIV